MIIFENKKWKNANIGMKMGSFKRRNFIEMEKRKGNINIGMKMGSFNRRNFIGTENGKGRKWWYENGQPQEHEFYRNGKLVDGFFTFEKKLQFLKIQRYFRSRIIGENYTLISDLAKMI